MHIPESLAQTILDVHGEEGAAWLEQLPALIAECAARWSLQVGPPFAELSYNYVASAVRPGGEEAVLKLGFPGPELRTEIEALRLYGGRGAVRVLASDAEQGAMLLERLRPGTPLADLEDDEEATAIAAQVMRRLWRPAQAAQSFPTTADWAAGLVRLREEFGGDTGPFPEALVSRAEGLFGELLASSAAPVLLHGDLHHWNIVAAGREPWLAIDPKGLVGEPAYEVGALLRNRLPADLSEARRLTARRVDQLAEALGFDRQRLIGWVLAQGVLSAWWCWEDGGQIWDQAILCAEACDGL